MIDPQDKKQKQKKKYKNLNPEWRQNCLQDPPETLYKKIQDIAIADYGNTIAKEMDPDINDLKEKLRVANEPYQAITKENKIKVAFIIELLEGMGKDVPSYESFLKKAAKSLSEKKD